MLSAARVGRCANADFAVQAHQWVLAEVEVLCAQAGDLLRAGSGVVEEQDQGAVAQCERAVAGQVAQEVLDLVAFGEPVSGGAVRLTGMAATCWPVTSMSGSRPAM